MSEVNSPEQALELLRAEIANLRARVAIDDEVMGHLREIYSVAYIEGHYDPFNDRSYEAAVKIWPHIKALNGRLAFSR